MHPLIKVLTLLVMIIMIVQVEVYRVIAVAGVLLVLLFIAGREYWQHAGRMAWRLKWLWLSLLVFYGWFIPGEPLIHVDDTLQVYLPARQGIAMALLRIGVLLNIVTGVVLVLRSTPRDSLVVVISWLLRPVNWLGLDATRFAARMVLAIDEVTTMDRKISAELGNTANSKLGVERAIDAISRLLLAIEKRANEVGQDTVILASLGPPALPQWLIPVALCLLLVYVK